MKKQVSVICGICANTKYLFCDETFDGLDPVMRQAVKSLFAADMEDRNLTLSSHPTISGSWKISAITSGFFIREEFSFPEIWRI